MGVKQDITVMNEFSVKTARGGTRGGTPGNYVLRYMARDGAVEDLSPVLHDDVDTYITRYMAREDAVETLGDVPSIKGAMRRAQGFGGVAFGPGDVSMSHEKVLRVSERIQRYFDEGKTALKTVISFDTEYLRRMNVIPPDFMPLSPGDFRGKIDELKLRMAIQRGMARMAGDSKRFSELEWIGVIQIDTMHVHCHLCAIDAGRGLVLPNGQQRGKISDASKRQLRRGIDLALSEYNLSRMKAANITFDRQNVKWYVSRFAHKTIEERGLPQFLLSCLPEDSRLWRASTNRKEMRKPNAIVREYVENILESPESGFSQAMLEIGEYAAARRRDEDLTGAEERSLIDAGRERIVTECMNSVYGVLRKIPKELRGVRTPMLDSMSMDFEQMASMVKSDPMVEFGFKLRSYSSRLSHHKRERAKYRANAKEYERAAADGAVSPDSKALFDFYRFEEEYNARLVSKYQHFLLFLPPEKEYADELDLIVDQRSAITNLKNMMADSSIKRMEDANAERYGRTVYGQRGGSLVKNAPDILEDRLSRMENTLSNMIDDMRVHLSDEGLLLDEEDLSTSVGVEFDFDDVKALDIHHLAYDWGHNIDVSQRNVTNFLAFADERCELYDKAVAYLRRTHQVSEIDDLPGYDIEVMRKVADAMRESPVLVAMKPDVGGMSKRSSTFRLDIDYSRDIKEAVQQTIEATESTFG